jgi:pimeloyl-ACP methyl ester carboxylesterase
VRRSIAIAMMLAAGGCYFSQSPMRPIPALFARTSDARQHCLVVFLPGLLDGADSFLEHGMVRDLFASGAPCDAAIVDLGYRYYFGAQVADVLYEDVLHPALARGYDEVWVVGISLGGLGATLLARQHGEAIAGVMLLSPFLGIDPTMHEVASAGLREWHPPHLSSTVDDTTFTAHVWAYLRGYVDDPDELPPLYVGWAEGESRERMATTIADVLPSEHTAHVAGGHDWQAWTQLFRTLIAVARPGR